MSQPEALKEIDKFSQDLSVKLDSVQAFKQERNENLITTDIGILPPETRYTPEPKPSVRVVARFKL